MFYSTALVATLLAASQLVAGHGAIIKAVGDAGGNGAAIGTDPSTPRDGTKRNPFQQDTTRFRGANADACGQTLAGGDNSDIAAGVKAVMANSGATMPQITQGGQIMMTLHQVNGDGAGPYTCGMDSTGTAAAFTDMQVTMNVPGKNSRSKAKATDFPLNVQVPQDATCTGSIAGQNNVCLVRCMNAARAGPFGGCVAVQMTGAGAAASGNTTTTPAASTAKTNDADAQADSQLADTQDSDN